MKKKQSLNVVIPVYNEEKELATNITTLVDFLQKHLAMINWQMSIVDNASTEAFYKRNGYDLHASLKDFYADGDPKQIYSKVL